MRQKYYLDELFDYATPPPNWATAAGSPPLEAVGSSLFRKDELNATTLSNNWQKILSTNAANAKPVLGNGTLSLQLLSQNSQSFQLSLADLFPNLDTTALRNYELRIRLKDNGNAVQFNWQPNGLRDHAYYFSNAFCGPNTFSVYNYWGGQYSTNGIQTNSSDWDEYIFRCKDDLLTVWLNQKVVFTSDIMPITQPFNLYAYFTLYRGVYDFDYFRLYKL